MIKDLQHLPYEERMRMLVVFSLKKRRLTGLLSMCVNTRREGVKKTKTGSFQWCPVEGQEAMVFLEMSIR